MKTGRGDALDYSVTERLNLSCVSWIFWGGELLSVAYCYWGQKDKGFCDGKARPCDCRLKHCRRLKHVVHLPALQSHGPRFTAYGGEVQLPVTHFIGGTGAHYHYTVLYCTVLYCTVLYCTVLYCIYPNILQTYQLNKACTIQD